MKFYGTTLHIDTSALKPAEAAPTADFWSEQTEKATAVSNESGSEAEIVLETPYQPPSFTNKETKGEGPSLASAAKAPEPAQSYTSVINTRKPSGNKKGVSD